MFNDWADLTVADSTQIHTMSLALITTCVGLYSYQHEVLW